MEHISFIENSEKFFKIYDYIIFVIILLGSTGIAIYYGCFGNQQSSAKEYLLAGRSMKIWPVAISLTAR